VVAAQDIVVDGGLLLLGGGHEVRLVLQGALAQAQPDGGEVALLAPHADVPATNIGVAIDGEQQRVLPQLLLEPPVDEDLVRSEVGKLLTHIQRGCGL